MTTNPQKAEERQRPEPIYRLMTEDDAAKVSLLAKKVFDKFVLHCFEKEGIELFYEIINPEAILKRSKENHFTLIAQVNHEIIGMIEIQSHEHIKLLFVDEKSQNRSIARSLLNRSIELCLKSKSDLTQITVNSSSYALKIYQKLGFEQTASEQIFKGMLFTPMVLKLSKVDYKNRNENGIL